MAGTVLELVRTRIELVVIELREEGERRKQMLVLAAVGAVFLTMTLLLLAFFVVVLFWDQYRLAAIGTVTLVYAAIGVVAILKLQDKVRTSPPPFEASLAEFAKDVDALRGGKKDE